MIIRVNQDNCGLTILSFEDHTDVHSQYWKESEQRNRTMRFTRFIWVGLRRTTDSFRFLLNNKRLILFLALPYAAIIPIFRNYHFTLGFPLFPLAQVSFLLFNYTESIQSNMQRGLISFTLFNLPSSLHYLWIPLICFMFTFTYLLFISYATGIMITKRAGNIEKSLHQVQFGLYNSIIWSLLTTLLIIPLGILWSFSKQETLIQQSIFPTHPIVASFLTSVFFDFFLLFILFLYQLFLFFLLPIMTLEKRSFFSLVKVTAHRMIRFGSIAVVEILFLSVLWGILTWVFNDFISIFILPLGVHALSLVFLIEIYIKYSQIEKKLKINPEHKTKK